jgi:site-specific recombinase XerD
VQYGHALSGEAIGQVLNRRSLAGGVKALSPHDLRRSYPGNLLDAGADLPAVQQLLGQSSPATTFIGDKARRTADSTSKSRRPEWTQKAPPIDPRIGRLRRLS